MRARLTRLLILTATVATTAQAATGPLPAIADPTIASVEQELEGQGFTKWIEPGLRCADCATVLVGTAIELQSPNVQTFMRTLGERKAEIMSLYRDQDGSPNVMSDEYNELARMAVGILGRESRFFTSTRYQIKEEFPQTVHVLKELETLASGRKVDTSPNSRGPTQIKVVPARIAKQYGITEDQLADPEKAAIATMGFLIESLTELKRMVVLHQLTEVTPENEMDYLPYIYFGSTKALIAHRANPSKNAYITEMKSYMSWVDVFEKL